MDPQNGYDATTHIYHSLHPSLELPPETLPLSAADFALSLLRSTSTNINTTTAFIDGSTGLPLSYSDFLSKVRSLSASFLFQNRPLSKGDVALIVCPPSLHIPVLYFALLSLGIVVFATDPLSIDSELASLVKQAQPAIAFTISSLANKVASLPYTFSHPTIFIDSIEFDSMLTFESQRGVVHSASAPIVHQSDIAVMISSSGTTGPAKIVEFTHRNVIASISLHGAVDTVDYGKLVNRPIVTLLTAKLELCLGFTVIMRNVAMAQSLVILERCKDLGEIMEAVERYKVDVLFGYPMLVGAMAAQENAEVVDKYDVTSLKMLISGGMQLHERHFKSFKQKFPHANVMQGYGLTEICGGATLQLLVQSGLRCYGTVGRLMSHLEAQIVDPSTAHALSPGLQGELWLRGPTVMRGYVRDDKLTATRLCYEDGWFKTGDVCYFDPAGYLYHVDRLKEFIIFNSYKVSPSEIERILLLHAEIEDAVVLPCEVDGGEVPMALIIKRQGSTLTESRIMDFVATKVEQYKKLRHVRFITSLPNFGKENSLPISHQGKIQRKLIVLHHYNN